MSTTNVRIDSDSASRNVGLNSYAPADTYEVDNDNNITEAALDRDRRIRILNSTVDHGAYENDASSTCCADINGNGCVNVTDLLAVIADWDTGGLADIAPESGGDGVVNVTDLLLVIARWGQQCPGFTCQPEDFPTSVGECMSTCSQQYPNDPAAYNACLTACIEALCKAGYINCD